MRLFNEYLDKKFHHEDYTKIPLKRQAKIVIIGDGPSGLRAAIEAAILGYKVVLIEQRPSFTRNNVLHLWKPNTLDLKSFRSEDPP